MTTYKGPISDPTVKIQPSEALCNYISRIDVTFEDMPLGIRSIVPKNSKTVSNNFDITQKYLTSTKDYEKIKSFEKNLTLGFTSNVNTINTIKIVDKVLSIQDLRWLYEYIKRENHKYSNKVYLHELLEGSKVLLPENVEVIRNPELEKRCQHLRIQQENERYYNMTKNVDNVRRRLPEDSIGYQMKEMNKQLIAIFQFIISVIAGFAFGFIGIEVLVGTLDVGFRLLLGIIFALIVALAELYFLAKKLNEDYGEPQASAEKAKVD